MVLFVYVYSNDMIEKALVQEFLDILSSKYPYFVKHFPVIQQACDFALHAHAGQKRKYSWGPFIEHPLSVALIWAKRFNDINLLVASILHDCVEDNENIDIDTIYTDFGQEVGFIVDAVTDTTDYFLATPTHIFSDRIEKIFYGGMYDVRCILLKLHDRENNITTLWWLEPHKQIRMSFETQAIYEPLKKLFGLHSNKPKSIDFSADLLHHYLLANHITTPKSFKETLLNQTFFDFDNDTFNLVYNNSNRIFWEINDKEVFEKLIESRTFDEKIDIISLQQTVNGKFLAIFKYKKWNVFEWLKSKLKIHTSFS